MFSLQLALKLIGIKLKKIKWKHKENPTMILKSA